MKKKDFFNICRKSQADLKVYLEKKLKDAGYLGVNARDGFIYAKGDIPVLLTAHMDTVHEKLPKHIMVNEGKMSSPNGIGGDDRCGIFIILSILSETDLRPSILFCEDEEIGGVGSEKFTFTKFIDDLEKLKFLIEIDRQGKNDAVFYNCANADFINWIEGKTGFREAWGSFSDISNLSPACGVASVNLSCGYYKQHTKEEYVVWDEMCHSKDVVIDLIKASETCVKFEYIEDVFDDWGYFPQTYTNNTSVSIYILYKDKDGREYDCEYYGCSETEAFGEFFIDNPDVCFSDIIDWYKMEGRQSWLR